MGENQSLPERLIYAKELKVGDRFGFNIKHDTVIRRVTEIERYVTSFSEVFVSYDYLGTSKRSGGMAFKSEEEVILRGGDL